jgi:hypothetical protein
MIATSRFVFLHLHKSGGTFVNECLLRFVPGARQIGYHLPRSLVPAELATLPALGLVRNPWSYYVSWHAYQAARATPNALYRVLSDEGRRDFKGTVCNLLDLGRGSPHLDRLLALLPTSYGNRGINLPAFALAPIRDSGLGFYSFLYRYMFGEPGPALRIGHMESLRTELPRMLADVGQPVDEAMREFIRDAAPRNVVGHARYEDMYDEELRNLVADRDAPLIARHGFTFGD